MSKELITTKERADIVIPVIRTDIFMGSESPFYVGKLAVNRSIELLPEYKGTGILRANVYIDEMGYLPPDARKLDGTESDEYDSEAVHFGVFEKCDDIEGSAFVVGCMRGIIRKEGIPLPVENIFPDAFKQDPAPVGSIEASRYIARHYDKTAQTAVSLSLIRVIVGFAMMNERQPIYALVEESLATYSEKIGLPLVRLTEPREVPEYGNTENMVLRFMPEEVVAAARTGLGSLRRYFNDMDKNSGLGYYDRTLTIPESA